MSARFNEPKIALNRIYTRGGDAGETRLVGGQQVGKDSLRVVCYGTVDELNADVGVARIECMASGQDALASDLRRVLNALFNLGSILATLPEDVHPKQPRVTERDVAWLEGCIDRDNAELPTLRSFVLPGGNRASAALHRARTVCRRAERLCVTLGREEEVDGQVVPYLNRLSDALFVWSRRVALVDGGEELMWRPDEA